MRRFAFIMMILLLTCSLSAPVVAGGGNPSFPDLKGHWAAAMVQEAVTTGYVNGYPDGTFRPNEPVTRAEITKLLVAAGQIELNPDRTPGRDDLAGHWVTTQGYLNTAAASAIFPDIGRLFRPDDPATRLDVLTWTLGLLGRPYSDPPEPSTPLPFADEIGAADRRWVKAGLDLGLVSGYPDNTFRPQARVTRAEAVVIVQRALAQMAAGTDANQKLVVDGAPVPGAVLTIRNGIVYAPVQAVYPTVSEPGSWQEPQSYSLLAANGRYVWLYGSLSTAAGNPKALLTAKGTTVKEEMLLAGPYIRFGRLMFPVAPLGGKAPIPYGSARHDTATATVAVTHSPDWPGFLLPTRPDQLRMYLPGGSVVGPGFRADLRVPLLMDAQDNLVRDRQMPPVTFTFDQATPIRFPDGTPRFTTDAAHAWQVPEPSLMSGAPAGKYSLHITADGYPPLDQEIDVVN